MTSRSLMSRLGKLFADASIHGILAIKGVGASLFDTLLVFTAPTATRTITFPDASGTLALGNAAPVPSGGATVALSAAQSGATLLFDAATGVQYTLPPPAPGLRFRFLVTVTATSNQHRLITDAGTTFMQGTLSCGIEATTPGANPGPKFFSGNGSSHIKINMEGTGNTTGGVKGSWFEVMCVSATQWQAWGNMLCAGTIATPFST